MNNKKAILLASFFTLIAAGVGFAIRGGILGDWGAQFGFSKTDLGKITGGGLVGFGVVVLLSSLFVDRIGYKPLLLLAFVLHVLSAVITLMATYIFNQFGKGPTYECLYWSMFMFAVANGLCEAVINPLVADLYPKQKTHYLNILHAGWPAGLVIGGLFAYFFAGRDAAVTQLRWEIPMAFFLIPTFIYGFLVIKEKFPVSEVRSAGVNIVTMLSLFASPVLLLLMLLHAMVGYVELGTDSWITNIMNNVIAGKAILLFVYTSSLMFILRFFAGPIVEKINPIGLLLASSLIGAVGLYWLGSGTTGISIFLAGTTYGIGKTFLWPTMLGVVGERFPKGGAITMGAVGAMGALSAGLLGGPGIGYKQDYFAAQKLEQSAPETFTRYVSVDKKSFLFFPSIAVLDGTKVGALKDQVDTIAEFAKLPDEEKAEKGPEPELTDEEQADKDPVAEANIYGGRMALKWTAVVPLCMALGYLFLVIYFRSKGGYRVEVLHGEAPDGERYTGGVEAPLE